MQITNPWYKSHGSLIIEEENKHAHDTNLMDDIDVFRSYIVAWYRSGWNHFLLREDTLGISTSSDRDAADSEFGVAGASSCSRTDDCWGCEDVSATDDSPCTSVVEVDSTRSFCTSNGISFCTGLRIYDAWPDVFTFSTAPRTWPSSPRINWSTLPFFQQFRLKESSLMSTTSPNNNLHSSS